jgi:hypothetical protein
MSRFWRTISRTGRKRVQVRSGKPGRSVHIHKTTGKGDDWSGAVEIAFGAFLTAAVLCVLWEAWPVILVCAVIGLVLATCMG